MGIFDKKKTTTNTTTNVVTETTTTMRDVGLTGAQAVEMAATLEEGGIAREAIASQNLTTIADLFSQGFNLASRGVKDLVSGTERMTSKAYVYADDNLQRGFNILKESGALLKGAAGIAEGQIERTQESTEQQQKNILNTTEMISEALLQDTKDVATGGMSQLLRFGGFFALGMGALIVFIIVRK